MISGLAMLAAAPAGAASMTFNQSADFFAALAGQPTFGVDFEDQANGATIPSGTTLGSGAQAVTFSYDLGGVLLGATDGTGFGNPEGPFSAIPPGDMFLGTNRDPGDFFRDLMQGGDGFSMTFASATAIGLYVVTAEAPDFTIFDGDVTLSAGVLTASLDVSEQDASVSPLPDGSLAYFLGILNTDTPFSEATLDSVGVPLPYFFNVDDVVIVPEPSTVLLVLVGLAGLAAGGVRPRR